MEVTVNTREAVAPWCSIDLSSGNLTVVLEPFNCFDAEVYADELELGEPVDFRDDQRSTHTLCRAPPKDHLLMLQPAQSALGGGYSAIYSPT